MKKCDWCGQPSEHLEKCSSLGNEYDICQSCSGIYKAGKCRLCGEPLGMNSIKGQCIMCAQRDYYEDKKKEEQISCGSNPEIQKLYTSESTMSEADFESWMTFGQGNFSPEKQRCKRQEWLTKKLEKSEFWTRELIEKNMEDIEILMERNFSKIFGKKYILIYLDSSNLASRFIECVDKEHQVMLIDVKELRNN